LVYIDGSDEHIKEGDIDDVASKLERLTAPVVAAAPGFQLLSFVFYGEKPTIEEVLHPRYRNPNIAWRLCEYRPKPIALDEDFFIVGHPAGEVAILYPDGRVVELAEESKLFKLLLRGSVIWACPGW
jgi:hypothetical protein